MENKKKILITTGIFPPDIGGPASYALFLGKKLSDVFDIEVITYSSKKNCDIDKKLPFKVIRVWRGWPKFFRHLVYFVKVYSRAKKADVIYTLNAISAGIPAYWAAKMLSKKFIVRTAGDYAWETANTRSRDQLMIEDFQKSKKHGWVGMLNNLQIKVCKKADMVIVPSNWLANMVKRWGVSTEKVRVIYNGVDFKAADMTTEEARKKIGVVGNIIISVGRLLPLKGFRMLIKIMPTLLEMNQFFRLVIVGDGPDGKILGAMIRNMRLENKVYLVGKKNHEELSVYFRAADIFVLNTSHEGFSHQILESMMAETPVITTAVGGNLEVIKQGENGFMVKYNDEFNLVEAIKTLWYSEELRNQFIKEGNKTVEKFSMERMLEETERAIKNIL
jgi:glycosyltransferase involved in cell wall biosynthesis